MKREKLEKQVIKQIKKDLEREDVTAIYELLKGIDASILISYLPEEIGITFKKVKNYGIKQK